MKSRVGILGASAFWIFLLVYPPAWSQEIPFVPTPNRVIERMLQLAEVTPKDVVYDLGSGDGRIVILAAKKYGARGVGVDIDPQLVERARANAKTAGVSHLVEFRAADALTVDISEATVVTLYMFKWFNNQMRPKLQSLRPGSRVVAHDYDIDGWAAAKVEEIVPKGESGEDEITRSHTLYLWRVEGKSPSP
jgi:SAM-dependent methyltransferase